MAVQEESDQDRWPRPRCEEPPQDRQGGLAEFTDGYGDQRIAFAHHVLFELPDVMPVGENGHVNFVPAKLEVLVECLRYAIGKHAPQAQQTGRGSLIVQTKYPIGTDPRS